MLKYKRSEIPALRTDLLKCRDIKSTKLALMVLTNLDIANAEYKNVMSGLEKMVAGISEKYKDIENRLIPFNETLQANIKVHLDQNGSVKNQQEFEASVEKVLEAFPECKPFYLEQREAINGYYSEETVVDIVLIQEDDLPDNLSAADISLISFMVTDTKVVV